MEHERGHPHRVRSLAMAGPTRRVAHHLLCAETNACEDCPLLFIAPCCAVAQDAREVRLQQEMARATLTDRDEFNTFLQASQATRSHDE